MFLYSFFYALTLISLTHGLNCIVCSSATDVNCVDPSHADASVLNGYTRPGFVSCIKTEYWGGYGTYAYQVVIRSGQQEACAYGSTTGTAATAYCCSDKDNCNSATTRSISFILFVCLLTFIKLN